MPIMVWVDADPQSCRQCAAGLTELARGIEESARGYGAAADAASTEWRQGDAVDAFRERVETVRRQADKLSDESGKIARALTAFADDIQTVKARMIAAADHAIEGGLFAGPNPCDPYWIGDPASPGTPPPGFIGPVAITEADQARYAKQQAVYQECLDQAADARKLETTAHAKLRQAMLDESGAVQDAATVLRNDWTFVAASAAQTTVAAGVEQANKWKAIADQRWLTVERMRQVASETVEESYRQAAIANLTRAASAFGNADDAFERGKLYALGNNESAVSRGLSRTFGADASKLLSKFPVAGAVITGFQTGFDIHRDANDVGDAVRIAAGNSSGYVAGSLAAAGLGAVGAPVIVTVGLATVVAVGTGVVVDRMLR